VNDRVPDYSQYRVGYREWNVKEPGFLTASAKDYIWPPKQQYESDPTPTMDNNGGFWAFLDLKELIQSSHYARSENVVFGRVAFWGIVIHHEKGLRAQYAYPLELMYHNESNRNIPLFKRAAERYGIPLKVYTEPPEWTRVREAELAAAAIADQTRRATLVAELEQKRKETHQRQLDRNKLQRVRARAALEYAKTFGFDPSKL